MSTTTTVDAAPVEFLLGELRLPGVKLIWAKLAEQSDNEGWPAARFLAALAEHEMADRGRRRMERHLTEARLPAGKTLATFDFDSVPMVSKAQVIALASGDAWLNKGANILMFGPPGGGKSHLSAALGLALVENGWRVFFARTTDLVQRLQVARSWRFSRRRRLSSSRSGVVRPSSRRPSSRSACATHLRIACAEGSNSLASFSGERPDRTNPIISRRNSGV
jgi:DNA replication protein DnaC